VGAVITLTQAERDRFAAYLEHEAHCDDGIMEQMQKLPGMAPMLAKLRAESLAAKVIAAKLRSIESEEIG